MNIEINENLSQNIRKSKTHLKLSWVVPHDKKMIKIRRVRMNDEHYQQCIKLGLVICQLMGEENLTWKHQLNLWKRNATFVE